jgi:hypothetical protein
MTITIVMTFQLHFYVLLKENAHFICNSKDHSNGDIMILIDAS